MHPQQTLGPLALLVLFLFLLRMYPTTFRLIYTAALGNMEQLCLVIPMNVVFFYATISILIFDLSVLKFDLLGIQMTDACLVFMPTTRHMKLR